MPAPADWVEVRFENSFVRFAGYLQVRNGWGLKEFANVPAMLQDLTHKGNPRRLRAGLQMGPGASENKTSCLTLQS